MTQELTEFWINPSCRSVAELALMLMFRRSVSNCRLKGTLMSAKVVYTLRCPWFLVNDQLDAQIPFYVFIFFIYNSLHVSSTTCSTSGETNCINTTSGNCQSVLVAVSCAGVHV